VKAGALGENTPLQDLVLAASHAVFTNGVLVPRRKRMETETTSETGASARGRRNIHNLPAG
jgi:hypothetical protein